MIIFFRPVVTWAVHNRVAVIAIALAFVIVLFGLLRGGRIGFAFFPNVEGNVVVASATFVAGTPPERVRSFIADVEAALYETNDGFGGGLVTVSRPGGDTFPVVGRNSRVSSSPR